MIPLYYFNAFLYAARQVLHDRAVILPPQYSFCCQILARQVLYVSPTCVVHLLATFQGLYYSQWLHTQIIYTLKITLL